MNSRPSCVDQRLTLLAEINIQSFSRGGSILKLSCSPWLTTEQCGCGVTLRDPYSEDRIAAVTRQTKAAFVDTLYMLYEAFISCTCKKFSCGKDVSAEEITSVLLSPEPARSFFSCVGPYLTRREFHLQWTQDTMWVVPSNTASSWW